ncbi:MAG: TonB family protein, partial [Gammaproteobacteria bacterium]|nr:TonB family protein [Gammaproteobacteria bacterium]
MVRPVLASNISDEIFLPWVESANDRRFKQILIIFVVVFSLISAIVPFLPVPEIIQADLKTVSPHLSRLIMEKKKQPPPPPPIPEANVPEKNIPVKKSEKLDKKEVAYKKAASSGLVALSNELAELRESFDFSMLDAKPLIKSVAVKKQSFDQDLITAKATSSSSGIAVDKATTLTGTAKLSERSTTKVTSDIADKISATRKSATSGKKISRGESEIEQVFQKNKGAIYNLYNRALRKDPTLGGKVIIELTINAQGKVVQCHIISSELNDPGLERKIIARVKMFQFKPADVLETTVK